MRLVLRTAEDCRRLWAYVQGSWRDADPPLEVSVTAHRSTRSSEQNARLWAMLDEVSLRVDWHGQKLTAEEWKEVMSAGLKQQKVVPGLEGGFVVIGARTSKMTIAEMTALMDLIEAFGAQQGVEFGETAC